MYVFFLFADLCRVSSRYFVKLLYGLCKVVAIDRSKARHQMLRSKSFTDFNITYMYNFMITVQLLNQVMTQIV